MPANDDEWKKLTFAQRVGAEPLPAQLRPDQVSKGLRAALWGEVFMRIAACAPHGYVNREPWRSILFRKHVEFDQGMADDFTQNWQGQQTVLSNLFRAGQYHHVYGCIEFFLMDEDCPHDLSGRISNIFEKHQAPYQIIDQQYLMPIASGEQGKLVAHALEALRKTPMAASSAHLKHSIEFLNKGQWAKSISESIHAVESVARKIEPSANTLDPALKKLAPKIKMHPALKDAFGKLYGYTSDEQGIRHALIDQPTAAVDRDDAIFMLTACAAFSSYLVNKATTAALL
jgi:hypothetical protein